MMFIDVRIAFNKTHARIQKVLSEGVELCKLRVFKLMRGRQRIHITLKSDHLNCVSLAGGDGPTLNAGLVAL